MAPMSPPHLATNPLTGQPFCRLDCTFCADGEINDGETCDDGNTVSGCGLDGHPQRPLDSCLNNCTKPMCKDPARIVYGQTNDELSIHGRLTALPSTLDLSGQPFTIELSSGGAIVWKTTLPAGVISKNGRGFQYRNDGARASSGVASLKATEVPGSYVRLTLDVFGTFKKAPLDMTTHISVGTTEWTERGVWRRTSRGLQLVGKLQLQP